jgi:hypothetical protein
MLLMCILTNMRRTSIVTIKTVVQAYKRLYFNCSLKYVTTACAENDKSKHTR